MLVAGTKMVDVSYQACSESKRAVLLSQQMLDVIQHDVDGSFVFHQGI